MITNSEFGVSSETGSLQSVLMHRPDMGIERVTPQIAVELLYEDIVFLPKMEKEYALFTEALAFFIKPENVVEFEDLLETIIKSEAIKTELIRETAAFEKMGTVQVEKLSSKTPAELKKIFITGSDPENGESFFDPLPNLIFTRDIGVMVGRHILVSRAAKRPRKRENLLCRYVFGHHPMFENYKLIAVPDHLTVEGGDIMMLEPGHILIASSERTSDQAAEFLTDYFLSEGIVEKVSHMALPKLRFCMHLDTIFTKFDTQSYVGYQPLVCDHGDMPVHQFSRSGEKKYACLSAMLSASGDEPKIIPCGNGISPFQEREQWTDACNLFAIKDGVAFTYDRNYYTNRAFQEAGYHLTTAGEIITLFKTDALLPEQVEKTIITIPSSELSRARGGPHCMTMPLGRIC